MGILCLPRTSSSASSPNSITVLLNWAKLYCETDYFYKTLRENRHEPEPHNHFPTLSMPETQFDMLLLLCCVPCEVPSQCQPMCLEPGSWGNASLEEAVFHTLFWQSIPESCCLNGRSGSCTDSKACRICKMPSLGSSEWATTKRSSSFHLTVDFKQSVLSNALHPQHPLRKLFLSHMCVC